MFPSSSDPTLHRTRRGWRLSQYGTVLSEILRQPGPTHSVFDVAAAACLLHPRPRDIALLGLGGGGILAALRALGVHATVHAVDLDPTGLDLLRRHHADWLDPLRWQRGDAIALLRRSPRRFDEILDDLSVPVDDEVEKPEASWNVLPALIASRLASGGRAVFNLLRPPTLGWTRGLSRVTAPFSRSLSVHLTDFDNRLVLAGALLPEARPTGRRLRAHLRQLRSRQATRLAISASRIP